MSDFINDDRPLFQRRGELRQSVDRLLGLVEQVGDIAQEAHDAMVDVVQETVEVVRDEVAQRLDETEDILNDEVERVRGGLESIKDRLRDVWTGKHS